MEISPIRKWFPAALCLGLIWAVCASGLTAQPADRNTTANTTGSGTIQADPGTRFDLNPQAFQFYVAGLLATQEMQHNEAAQLFRQALQLEPDSYEIRLSLAESYYYMRQPQLALDVLTQINPVTVDVYLLSGFCYRMLGDNQSAKRVYHKTLELESDNATALSSLASTYQQEDNFDSTWWAYEQLVKGPGQSDFRLWNDVARFRMEKGLFDSARAAYRQSLALDSTVANVMALAGSGELLLREGHEDSALEVFRVGLSIDSSNTFFLNQLMAFYARADSLEQALPYARKIADLAPLDREAWRRLGIIYLSTDSIEQADSIFLGLVASGDTYPGNHFYLGAIAMLKEDYPRAKDEYLLLTSLDDTSTAAWVNLGAAYRELGDTAKEMATYEEGLRKISDPSSRNQLQHAMAGSYERAKERDKAAAIYEEILQKDPDDALAMNNLGYMLADQGQQLDRAKELIKRALDSDPENAAYLDSYGWVYYQLGDYDKAIQYLEAAVAKASDPALFEHLGDAYRAKGDADAARKWYQRALELSPENLALQEKLTH